MALQPIYLAALVLQAIAWIGYLLTRTGVVPGFLIYTPLLVATSVGLGLYGAGLSAHPLVIMIVTMILAGVLIGLFYFHWGNLL